MITAIRKFIQVISDSENRSILRQSLRDIYYSKIAKDYGVHSVSLDKIVNLENMSLYLENFRTGSGNVTYFELLSICAIVKHFLKPGNNFLEIGTFDGNTILNVSLNIPESSLCYTIDLPPLSAISDIEYSLGDLDIIHSPSKQQKKHLQRANIRQIYSDSMKYDFSKTKFSGAFIDGAHHYTAVKNDTENIFKYIERPGFVLWHDYFGYNDVAKLLHDISKTNTITRICNTNLCLYIAD